MDNKTYEEDFKMIRSAIDGAKNPMNQLGGFFKSYAIINRQFISRIREGNVYWENDMFCLFGVLYFPNVQRGKKQY